MQIDIKQLKERLNRDDVVSILNSTGYSVETRTFKFCLRDEKTASAVINLDNSIHDYGSGYHGDILDLLVKHNSMSLADAIKLVANHLGMSEEQNYSYTPRAKQKTICYQNKELSDEVHKRILNTIKHFEADNNLCTFVNDDYRSEALAIAPLHIFTRATRESIKRFRDVTAYDKQNKTLVIKIHNYEGKLISFKRRRLNAKKWITAKGTHPNKQCLVSITDEEKSIFIVEEHHDYLTAILLGINVLMIPTVNYKLFNNYEVNFLKNKSLVFIPDWKSDDLTGVEVMRTLAQQMKDISYHNRIFSLPKFLNDEEVECKSDKLDLSEVVELWGEKRIPLKHILEHITSVEG